MGKGLSAVAMDREYLDRRRMNMTRNRPRHAFGGVVQGANYFANGLISGATGLVVCITSVDGYSITMLIIQFL